MTDYDDRSLWPTLQDVLAARARIKPYLARTPLHRYAAIDELVGTEVYIKHENYQPIGVFKIRGGINLALQLTPDERERGLVTASTGNHGQSVSYAGQLTGTPVRIVVPEGANPGKVAAMRSMGAEVIFHGARFDDAMHHAEDLTARHGYRYVHVANEPHIVAGVATETLEMLEDQPDLDVIIVPVGGGSGASGACLVTQAANPAIRVIAAQSAQAPAAHDSWRAGQVVTAPNRTIAEGLETGTGFELTQAILRAYLHDFVLVDDDAIRQAVVWLIARAHTLAEAAGAAPLAAAYQLRDSLRGQKVGLVCSGGNMSIAKLRLALESAQEQG
jgi:threonine dehydratase